MALNSSISVMYMGTNRFLAVNGPINKVCHSLRISHDWINYPALRKWWKKVLVNDVEIEY